MLAHVIVAKFANHLPVYRQEKIFGQTGLLISRSPLAKWGATCNAQLQPLGDTLRNAVLKHGLIHTDEAPVHLLTQGAKKTHRAYVWACTSSQFSNLAAIVYDFNPSRAGKHARNFLSSWSGKLVCHEFASYKASFALCITGMDCMAHVQRKFFDLHGTNKSRVAEKVLHYIAGLYAVGRGVRELEHDTRQGILREKSAPIIDVLHAWVIAQRQLVPEGTAIAKALD